MTTEDRIWREGDVKWVWTHGESVPRYMWSQIPPNFIVDRLNTLEATESRIADLETRLELTPESAGHDGIYARDETIRLQDKRIEELGAIYHATNIMLAELGAVGEITTRNEKVSDLMDTLHDYDNGVYDCKLVNRITELKGVLKQIGELPSTWIAETEMVDEYCCKPAMENCASELSAILEQVKDNDA